MSRHWGDVGQGLLVHSVVRQYLLGEWELAWVLSLGRETEALWTVGFGASGLSGWHRRLRREGQREPGLAILAPVHVLRWEAREVEVWLPASLPHSWFLLEPG